MLFRATTRYGVPFSTHIFRKFISSPFSSKLNNTHLIKPKSFARSPKSVTNRAIPISENHRVSPNDAVSSSDVNSICYLLSNHTTEVPTTLDNLLIDFKDKLSSQLVLQILMNYRQLGRINTLQFFSWAGTQLGFQFDDSVIEYMADFLCRRKLFDDLKCFLFTVCSNNCPVSCRTFSICIRFLGRQGRIKEALCLFEEMESKFSCKPDNLVYNNMLYVLCKKESSGHFIDFAITIFRKIRVPDTYSYSNILAGLCKYGKFETALEVFWEMDGAGFAPTRSAVNTLIGELCLLSAKEGSIGKVRVKDSRRPFTILVPNVGSKSSGAIMPASKVFWAVNDLGLLPSAFVINRFISELCRLGKMEEALKVLRVIEEKKLRCMEESFTIVIQALCEHCAVTEVSQLYATMLSKGCNPKLVVYNSIICMLCKLGNLDDAEMVLETMNKKRCLPDHVIYTALIHAYGEVQKWKTAHSLLLEMMGLGFYPHFHTYDLVDKLLREHGEEDLSVKLEQKMDAQMLLKHCKAGELEAAYEKLRSMLERGIYPPNYITLAFERTFEKAGKLKTARELLKGIDKLIFKKEEAEHRNRD